MKDADFLKAVIRSDTGAWFETYGRIFGKDRAKGLIKPRQNYLQAKIQKVVNKMHEDGLPVRVIGLKPRQKGSTTYFSALTYSWLRRNAASAIVIGGQYSQVDECLEMLKTYQKNDAFDWGNNGEINAKGGAWSHGSRLKPETAKDAVAGIGGTHQVLHAFEVARWSRFGVAASGEVLANILKCVPLLPDTMIVLESTAEGQAGDFYVRYCDSIDAEKFLDGTAEIKAGSYVRVFAPWFEFDDSAMRLTSEQKREIQETLDSDDEFFGEQELIDKYGVIGNDGVQRLGNTVENYDVWEQLAWRRWAIREECKKDKNIFDRDYPHSWQTAFQKSGNMRFNQSGLRKMREVSDRCVPTHGLLEETKDKRVVFRKTDLNEAKFTIFERPIRGQKYLLSLDPMTGASQTAGDDPDFHGVFVMRAGYWDAKGQWVKPATAARIVPCRWDIPILEEAVWQLARFYGSGRSGCKIVVEMNQDKGATELLKLRGADLYRREIFNRIDEKTTKAFGFMTNPRTRENLVETLSAAIRNYDEPGKGVDILCPHALEECDNFVRKQNGRSEAAEGFHDDDVLSIALGLELIEHATTYVPMQPLSGWGGPPLPGRGQTTEQGGAYT